MMYVGAVSRDEQTGTSSINDFYSDEKNFVCLYANTMKLDKSVVDAELEKSEGNPDTVIYDRDSAPLHCRVRKLTWNGWKIISEWGHENKINPEEAILRQPFDWFSGSW